MKTLTDAYVAKKLGWKKVQGLSASENSRFYWRQKSTGSNSPQCPRFTTSLDAIVAEVEARDRGWRVEASRPNIHGVKQYAAWVVGDVDGQYRRAEAFDHTAPLALCRALLAYLEDEK